MTPKRANSNLRGGGNRFGDFFDEKRAELVRADARRKRLARKWSNLGRPIPPSLFVREVEEFDRLRWEREVECRRRAQRNSGEGSSSGGASSSPPALPPPEEYDAAAFGPSVVVEDLVPDEMVESITALVMLSVREAEEKKAQVDRDEEIDQILLHQGLEADRLAAEKKAYWEADAEDVVDLVSDKD